MDSKTFGRYLYLLQGIHKSILKNLSMMNKLSAKEIYQLQRSIDILEKLILILKDEEIYKPNKIITSQIISDYSFSNLEKAYSRLENKLLSDKNEIDRLAAFIDAIDNANKELLFMTESGIQRSKEIPPLRIEHTRGRTSPKKAKQKPLQKPRRVNTGFAYVTNPDITINKNTPLESNKDYYFWFTISFRKLEDSIEVGDIILPHVPTKARLIVAVFGFQEGLLVTKGADVGELELQENGESRITHQPMAHNLRELEEQMPSAKMGLLKTRLFFPVQTPPKKGNFKMRCNIYWGQILIRSLLVHAEVIDEIESIPKGKVALRTVADYTLAQTFNPAHLNQLKEHRLSIFLNSNGDGTHSFHVYGHKGDQKLKEDDIRFSEGELQAMIKDARMRLRLASWGEKKEYEKNKMKYRYRDRKPNLNRLKKDLFNLAKWGYEFYCQIKGRVAGSIDAVPTLEKLIAEPAFIQIAMKESPAHILPAAIIYDYPFDIGHPQLRLCENFEKSFLEGLPLEKSTCFKGSCPNRENILVICPSGFWGFRHNLGMPLSIKKSSNVPPIIAYQNNLEMAVGVATDLNLLDHHIQALKNYKSDITWDYGDSRNKVFEYLKGSPHIVYFYCHGGELDGLPYLVVGPEKNEKPGMITPSNLDTYEIRWESPRPLVFLNGCHTTAVEPEQALQFVSRFVAECRCAGVIGTEITIFEELATVFAEEFFHHFFSGYSAAEAIRSARLKLLSEGNPLGLVYIPFVLGGIRLMDYSELPASP